MRKVNSFDKIKVGECILYTHKAEDWFGKYLGKMNGEYSFNLVRCSDGDTANEHSVGENFFNKSTGEVWKIYKLTKKEIEEFKFKVIVAKL